MITLKLNLKKGSIERLKRAPGDFRAVLIPAMWKCMYEAERTAKTEHLSGPRPKVLNIRSGRLRASIKPKVRKSGDTVRGEIGTNVIYARIHEMGGVITPKKTKALKFNIPGVGWRTAKKVTIPARPFLRPAMTENLNRFRDIFAKSIVEAFS